MIMPRVSLIFGLSLLAAVSDFPRVFSRDKWGENLRMDGRALLQSFTNRPGLDISREKAFSHTIPAPLDWNAREVSTPLELRRAVCESQGHEYHADSITGDDVPVCTRINRPPVKIMIILTADIYLRGSKLPPITDYLRIEGRCEVSLGRRCEIHAVSALCSRCQMPSEGAEDAICAACRFGSSFGRETTPLRLMGGAKVWLERIDMWGCRTQNNGGCIHVEAGNKLIWDETFDNDRFTYLRVKECKFSRGYAGEEGGVLFMDAGALAYFTECEFENNFAAGRSRELGNTLVWKSYDGYIGFFSATILESCEPAVPEITTRPAPKEASAREPYQQGEIFFTQAPPPGPPPVAGPPLPGSGPGVGDGIDDEPVPVDDDSDDSETSDYDEDDEDNLTAWQKARLGVLISIGCVVALGCAGIIALCWFCRIKRPQTPTAELDMEKDSPKRGSITSSSRRFLIGTSSKFLLKPRGVKPSPMVSIPDDLDESAPSTKESYVFSPGSMEDMMEFCAIPGDDPEWGTPAVETQEQKPGAARQQTLASVTTFLPSPEDVVNLHLQINRSRRDGPEVALGGVNQTPAVPVSMEQMIHPPHIQQILVESAESLRLPPGSLALPKGRVEALHEQQPSVRRCRLGSNNIESLQTVPSEETVSIRQMSPMDDRPPELWAEPSTDKPETLCDNESFVFSQAAEMETTEEMVPVADNTQKVTVKSAAADSVMEQLEPFVLGASSPSVSARKGNLLPLAEPAQDPTFFVPVKDALKQSINRKSFDSMESLGPLSSSCSSQNIHEQSPKAVLEEELLPAVASESVISIRDNNPRAQARPRAARHTRRGTVPHQDAKERLKGAWQLSAAASKRFLNHAARSLVPGSSPSQG